MITNDLKLAKFVKPLDCIKPTTTSRQLLSLILISDCKALMFVYLKNKTVKNSWLPSCGSCTHFDVQTPFHTACTCRVYLHCV